MNNDYGFELFSAQFDKLDLIKKSEKIEIYNVFDREAKTGRILKICKGRDLSPVCKALIDIRHPNVAVMYDFVYYDGNTYILEEMLQGETLADKIEREKKLSPHETVDIVAKVCDGLSVLHSMTPPVIHNDIKPSNIYICDDGNVKIFDYDISRVYKEKASHNTEIMATQAYASPAHYGYSQTDQRSDIYSLGVVIHEMLTGRVLDDNKKSIYKGKLSCVINKCIEYDPKNTYQSTKQLKNDLEKHLTHKKGKIVAILVVIVLLVLGASLFAGKLINESETPPFESDVSENDGFYVGNSTDTTENAEKTTTLQNTNAAKRVNVVSKLSGEMLSMLSLNDGTVVYIESISDECHIKTSTGIDKVL